jgi:hypothetical protein
MIPRDWSLPTGWRRTAPERARFIRAQIERARLPDYDPRWQALLALEERLKRHGHRTPLRLPGVNIVEYRRGFPYAVAVRMERFLAEPERLFARAPMQALHSYSSRRDLARLARSPALARLRELQIAGPATLQAPDVGRLADSPHAGGIRALVFDEHRRLSSAAAAALVRSPLFARLTHLNFTSLAVGPAVVEALASAGPANLDTLGLSAVGLRDADLAALASAPALRTVRSLAVSCNDGVLATGLRRLMTSPQVARLRQLDLSATDIGAEGLHVLAESPHLAGLEMLDLSGVDPTPESLTALAHSRHLTSLRALDLGCNHELNVAALCEGRVARNLTFLSLMQVPLGDPGAEALAGAPDLARLGFLSLIYCDIGPAGALALARSPYLDNVQRLWLYGNRLGRPARQALQGRFGERILL